MKILKLTLPFFFTFVIFFSFLHYFPEISFFILLSFSTVYIVGSFIDALFPSKYKVLIYILFSIFLYLIIGGFIFMTFSLFHILFSIFSDFAKFLASNKYFSKYIPEFLNYFKIHINKVSLVNFLVEIGTYSIIYPVITFFLLKERIRLKKGLLSLIPNKYFEISLNVFYHVNKKFNAWLKGLLIQNSVYSFICAIGAFCVVPKYALVLGIIGGISNIIPFFGTIFNYIFLSTIFYGFSGKLGIIIGVATVTLAQFVDMIIYPLAYSKVLSLPSSLIIISVLILGKFFGIIGMLIAVPLTAIIYAILVEFGRTIKYYHI